MDKEEFIEKINSLLKLIRTEYGLTQEKMAAILGISKKTLVESEKGRRSLGWTEVVSLSCIFSRSQILQNAFGGELYDIIWAISFNNIDVKYPKTLGGKVWWKVIEKKGGFIIQENMISKHYRILDSNNCRLYSSFNLDDVYDYLATIQKD